MKLSSLLMLLFCMNLSAGIHAQEAKFSVAVENSNIREIIRIIKQQSDYTFVYNVEELDHIGSITMNVKDSDVRTILDACLKNSGYTYSILDKVIVIRKAELQQQEHIHYYVMIIANLCQHSRTAVLRSNLHCRK